MPRRLVTLALTLALAPSSRADDWPQWMGPNRDNVWRETGLLDTFPAGGPKVVWKTPVAGGYAGPAVAGGRVYLTDFDTADAVRGENTARRPNYGVERVLCFDEATGKLLWRHDDRVRYAIDYPAGPRCTPLVRDGKVYTLGAMGLLLCLDAATGKEVWRKDLPAAYNTKPALWGYAAHPLLDGQKLITLAGGSGSHVVALDKDTGAEIWKSQSQSEQGYCPLLLTEAGGVRQLVVAGPDAVRGLDPATGKRLWSQPYKADNGSVIMTPVRAGDHLYVGGFKGRNLLLKLAADRPAAETVWKDRKGFGVSPVNVQPFLHDGVLYGYHDDGQFLAVELPSGKRLRSGPGPVGKEPQGVETAFIVKQADRFWFFTETGDLVIGKLSPKGYEEQSRAHVIDPSNAAFGRKVVWSMPAFANRRVYVRNGKELVCVDVAK